MIYHINTGTIFFIRLLIVYKPKNIKEHRLSPLRIRDRIDEAIGNQKAIESIATIIFINNWLCNNHMSKGRKIILAVYSFTIRLFIVLFCYFILFLGG